MQVYLDSRQQLRLASTIKIRSSFALTLGGVVPCSCSTVLSSHPQLDVANLYSSQHVFGASLGWSPDDTL